MVYDVEVCGVYSSNVQTPAATVGGMMRVESLFVQSD